MIGSFLTRGLVMALGYAYPAYECYKTVEMNKPDIEQLRFWCQYWILVAVLTVSERIGDTFVSWLPMYSEAKLAFFIYLWYPKTKGTTYVYDSFFKPYVAKHENEIDRNILELRARAGDIVVLYWQKVASYGQTRVFEILQFIASQSTPKPRPPQPPPNGGRARPEAAANPKRVASKQQSQTEDPPSPTSSTSSSDEPGEEEGDPNPPSTTNAQRTTPSQSLIETTKPLNSTKTEPMQIESASSSAEENANPKPKPPQDTTREEAGRVTRGRLRKTRSASAAASSNS